MKKMTTEQVNAVKDLVRYIFQEWMKPIESELAAISRASSPSDGIGPKSSRWIGTEKT